MRLDLGDRRDLAVEVGLGEQVEVVVASGAATGYRWDVEVDRGCRLVSRHATTADPASFGGERLEAIVVETTEEGTTTLVLRLGRPWEDEPLRSATVELHVGRGRGPA